MSAKLEISISSEGDKPQATAIPPTEKALPPVPPPMMQTPTPPIPAPRPSLFQEGKMGTVVDPKGKIGSEWWQKNVPESERSSFLRAIEGVKPPEGQKDDLKNASPIASLEVQEEAKRRLEKMQRDKAVDQEMRSMDADYAAKQEQREDEKARREEEREKRALDRLDAKQQRDEDYAAKQERMDDKQAKRDADRQQKQQERDEDYAAKQELRDQRDLQKQVTSVPEVVALYDEEAYRRRIRGAQADRERDKRMKEIREEMDPEFAQEEADKENREQAKLLAMGGAAIGGKVGRMMGIASQVIGNPKTMRAAGSLFGRQNHDDDEKNRKIADYDASEKEDRKSRSQPKVKVPDTALQEGMPKPSGNAPAVATGGNAEAPVAASGGMEGVAGMAGEALPIVGAAMALIGMIDEEMKQVGEDHRQTVRTIVDVSKASLSMGPSQQMEMVARGFDAVADTATALAPPLGMLTPAAKELVHGLVELRSEVEKAAKKLAQYDGALATQQANQEVAQMMRDIGRANRFGAQLGATESARFNMEQKLADITDRFMPLILKTLEGIFQFGEAYLSGVDNGLKTILRVLEQILTFEIERGNVFQMLADAGLGGINLRSLRDMLRSMQQDTPTTNGFEEFNQFVNGGFRVNDPFLNNVGNQQFAAPGPAIIPPV
jgi:hypothetical protein